MRTGAVLTLLAGVGLLSLLPAQQQVSPSEVRSVLARFDEAFNARDLDGCMDLFESENPEVMAALRDRLAAVLSMPRRLVQESALDGELEHIGPRTVARVCLDRRPFAGAGAPTSLREWCYFVFRAEADRAVPVMAVDLEPGMLAHVESGRFSCAPCNYSIGGVDGWLAVPLPPERTNVMEAVSFFLLGTDLTFDMSVHIEPSPGEPRPALERLVGELRGTVPGLRVDPREDWTPPSVPDAAAEGLQGTHARLTFADGRQQWVYLCTMGVMRYLMVARGRADTLRRHATDIETMLSSFVLKEPDISLERLSVHPLFMHTGGRFVDDRYVNTRHELEFTGPDSWVPGQRSGAFLFQVQYACPEDGARLWMTGYENPVQGPEASKAYADRMLENLCRSGGLVIADGGDGGWQARDGTGGFRTRTVKTVPAPGNDRRPVLFRLALRDDLLVVLCGYAGSDSQERQLRGAFDSLRIR